MAFFHAKEFFELCRNRNGKTVMNKEKADNILTEDIKQFYFKNLFINTHVQCTYIYLLDMLDTCGFFFTWPGNSSNSTETETEKLI